MIPDNILRQIAPKPAAIGSMDHAKVGWVFPDGSVVPCRVMAHRDVLPEQYRERYATLLEEYDRDWYEGLDANPDEHPEWHRYNPEWDCNRQLLTDLGEANYVRFGLFCPEAGTVKLELEGSSRGLKTHHDIIAYMVAALGVGDVWWTDSASYSYKRKRQRQFS
jgi:hypothetical protein